jgi:integrase
MTSYNAENERIKKDYFIYLKEANQKAETTINAVRKAILRYEEYTGLKSFKSFNKEQAIAFKKHLMTTKAERTGEPLAKATILSTLNALKAFYGWLSFQVGYKSNIHTLDIEYFNLSEKETRAAKAPKTKILPTLEQIRKALFAMPDETEIEKRDKALLAFTILTGLRDSAITSLKIKHIDLHREYVNQDPNEVKTKFSKKIDTFFFPVGDDIKAVFVGWVAFLREEKLYGGDDPLFPLTALGHDENKAFTPSGLEPKHWSSAATIRKIFKIAFERVDLPYFSPHKFRDTLAHIGQRICIGPDQFKAWSQNLGHESPLTTFTSYGQIDPHRQGELIKGLGEKKEEDNDLKEILSILKGNKDNS